jgi:hypothetical protein
MLMGRSNVVGENQRRKNGEEENPRVFVFEKKK